MSAVTDRIIEQKLIKLNKKLNVAHVQRNVDEARRLINEIKRISSVKRGKRR